VATCGTSIQPDGGPDTGAPPPDAPTTCSLSGATPCTTIPKLTGTQTLDGKGDDFCTIPSFTFGVANAAAKNNYNNVPNSQLEIVTAKVAWSSAGLSAFFDVADTSVQTVNMADATQAIAKVYQGDSIELYISSSDTLTGLTGTDNNTLHVTVPANGPAVTVKATSGGAATHTALPTAQYSQATTSTGYAIELRLPWPGSAPGAGTRIRFDLALNSADKSFGNVDDMRDAQLLFYLGTTGGTTTCSGAADAWCDDRTWCSTSLQ
jgi:cytoskeletal protein RodZ